MKSAPCLIAPSKILLPLLALFLTVEPAHGQQTPNYGAAYYWQTSYQPLPYHPRQVNGYATGYTPTSGRSANPYYYNSTYSTAPAYYQQANYGNSQRNLLPVQGYGNPYYGYYGYYPPNNTPTYGNYQYLPMGSPQAYNPFNAVNNSSTYLNHTPYRHFSNSVYTPDATAAVTRRPVAVQTPRAYEPVELEPEPQIRPENQIPTPRPPTPMEEFLRSVHEKIHSNLMLPFWRPTNESCWLSADATVSFFRPMQFATPLVTLGNANNLRPGALNQSFTTVAYGNNSVDMSAIPGIRLEAGMFLDDQNCYSLEWTGFMAFQRSQSFSVGGDANGNPVIARPFFNVATNAEDAFLVSLPNFFTGTVNVETTSRLYGMEFNARAHKYYGKNLHADGLFGLRYARLSENLTIQDQLTPIQNNQLNFNNTFVNSPNSLTDLDSFSTANDFFGAQIGGRLRWEAPRFSLDSFAKLALGVTREQVTINGSTTLVTPTGSQSAVGGILAQKSNIGTYSRGVLGFVPEFGLGVTADITPHVRARLGYSVLWWNNVVRPGSQIDRNVNPGQAPGSPNFGATTGAASPFFRFNDESFWSQSFTIGLEAHF